VIIKLAQEHMMIKFKFNQLIIKNKRINLKKNTVNLKLEWKMINKNF
jgi:hypothetical protein